MSKKQPTSDEQKAYGRGYRAGRRVERASRGTVIQALNTQVAYWRQRAVSRRAVAAAVERVFARVLSSQEPFDGFSRQEFIDEICRGVLEKPAAKVGA